ncbi:hypothetical protein PRAC110570_05620 [Propionibacterium acidifaciens]
MLLVDVLPAAHDGAGDRAAGDRAHYRGQAHGEQRADDQVLPVVLQVVPGGCHPGRVGVAPGVHVGVGEGVQAGRVGQVDGVVAGVGVRVRGPAGAQYRRERVGGQETGRGRVVGPGAGQREPVDAEGPGAGQAEPAAETEPVGAGLPRAGAGVVAGAVGQQPAAGWPADTEAGAHVHDGHVTDLDRCSAPRVVPCDLLVVDLGEPAQTVGLQFGHRGGPAGAGGGDAFQEAVRVPVEHSGSAVIVPFAGSAAGAVVGVLHLAAVRAAHPRQLPRGVVPVAGAPPAAGLPGQAAVGVPLELGDDALARHGPHELTGRVIAEHCADAVHGLRRHAPVPVALEAGRAHETIALKTLSDHAAALPDPLGPHPGRRHRRDAPQLVTGDLGPPEPGVLHRADPLVGVVLVAGDRTVRARHRGAQPVGVVSPAHRPPVAAPLDQPAQLVPPQRVGVLAGDHGVGTRGMIPRYLRQHAPAGQRRRMPARRVVAPLQVPAVRVDPGRGPARRVPPVPGGPPRGICHRRDPAHRVIGARGPSAHRVDQPDPAPGPVVLETGGPAEGVRHRHQLPGRVVAEPAAPVPRVPHPADPPAPVVAEPGPAPARLDPLDDPPARVEP